MSMEDYQPEVGQVVLIDAKDKRYRGTWVIKRWLIKEGRFRLHRYGNDKSMYSAPDEIKVKREFLLNLVGAVITTMKKSWARNYATE